ncbi:arsenate reductase ArsC [Candidatus Margulisiibacteriota bacterium]
MAGHAGHEKPLLLGLCTANRCRSQMFEAIFKHYDKDRFEVISAGTEATFVHPLAIKVLSEIGITAAGQLSKKICDLDIANDLIVLEDKAKNTSKYPLSKIIYVITLCCGAKQTCPAFPGKVPQEHWEIDDPDQYKGTTEELLPYFRATRDNIQARVKDFLKKRL